MKPAEKSSYKTLTANAWGVIKRSEARIRSKEKYRSLLICITFLRWILEGC
jgi:hypothetical protein